MTARPDARDDTPADAIGAAWELLDILPRSAATPSMTATTLEMVAASAAGNARPSSGPTRRSPWSVIMLWVVPAAAVIGGLAFGYVLGRATAPVVERRPPANVFERIEALEEQQRLLRQRQEMRERNLRRRPEQMQRQPPPFIPPPPGRPGGPPPRGEIPGPLR
jgi:hypothetical protein